MVKKKEAKDIYSPLTTNTLKLDSEREIALDFSTRIYRKFDKIIKAIILFGSSAKNTTTNESDIDLIILIDDVSLKWDMELTAWYREELGKLIKAVPYKKPLHINTVKLSTWWEDLMRGDPIVINIIRYGDPIIDFGGFFVPLKILLQDGKIKPSQEAIFSLIQRAPEHMVRANSALLGAVDGLYWAMVDSAHAALISAKIIPPSPEHVYDILRATFVDRDILKSKYADYYKEVYTIAKEIVHGSRTKISGKEIDDLIEKANVFIMEMVSITDELNK